MSLDLYSLVMHLQQNAVRTIEPMQSPCEAEPIRLQKAAEQDQAETSESDINVVMAKLVRTLHVK